MGTHISLLTLEDCGMNLIELLEMRKFNTKTKIKLVRHQDSRYDVNKIYKKGMLNIYQSIQVNNIFKVIVNTLFPSLDKRTTKLNLLAFIRCYRRSLFLK
jgi:hypothetical protein